MSRDMPCGPCGVCGETVDHSELGVCKDAGMGSTGASAAAGLEFSTPATTASKMMRMKTMARFFVGAVA